MFDEGDGSSPCKPCRATIPLICTVGTGTMAGGTAIEPEADVSVGAVMAVAAAIVEDAPPALLLLVEAMAAAAAILLDGVMGLEVAVGVRVSMDEARKPCRLVDSSSPASLPEEKKGPNNKDKESKGEEGHINAVRG